MIKTKALILLLSFFFISNATVFYITKNNAENKIDLILKENLKTLQTHYKILL